MAYIELKSDKPGIVGLLEDYPDTGRPLRQLAEVLLRGPSSLSEGERELIATYVSSRNDCTFCQSSHGAAAKHLLGDGSVVEQVKENPESAPVSDKLKALLVIAGQVQEGGDHVTEADIERARSEGASDREIHDTVLIAAAFCLYNRYVDGLGTFAPDDPEAYDQHGAILAEKGYLRELV